MSIADDAYNGTTASMSCVSIAVSAFPLTSVSSVSVQVAMSHTWIGDLVMRVFNPAGTAVTLLSRPGFTETADDGSGGPGDNANLAVAFPITFAQGAAVSAELMGNTSTATGHVVCQNDGICTYAPARGIAAGGDLSSYVGTTAAGTWRFCVGDSEVGDLGTIDRVVLTLGLL
jgi:hypothetical protein